jgi:hypothetical protein
MIPASASLTPLTSLAGRGTKLLKLLTTAADSGIVGGVQAFNESKADNIGDALDEAGAYGGLSALFGALGHSGPEALKSALEFGKVGAGKGMQVPGNVAVAGAEKLGGTQFAQARAAKKPNLATEWGDTATEDALKRIVNQGELGEQGAAAFKAGTSKLSGQALNTPVAQMAPEQSEAVVTAVAAALGAKGLPKDPAAATALMKAALDEAPDATAADVVRLVVRHDPANVARRVMTSFEAYDPVLKQMGIKADPRWAEVYKGASGLRGDFEAGKLNRVFADSGQPQPVAVGLPIQRGGPRTNVGSAVEEGADFVENTAKMTADGQYPRPYAADGEDGLTRRSGFDSSLKETEIKGGINSRAEAATGKGGGDLYTPNGAHEPIEHVAPTADEFDAIASKTNDPQRLERYLRGEDPNAAADIFQRAQDDEAISGMHSMLADEKKAAEAAEKAKQATEPWNVGIDEARARLQKIATGKNAALKIGKGASWVTGGAPGLLTGYSAKEGVKLATEAGKVLEGSGKAGLTPERMASSILANPNILTRLEAQGGKLGRAAAYVLAGAREGGEDALRARLWTMMFMPEVREYFANDDQEPSQAY